METVIWVTRCIRLRMRDMGNGGIMEILFLLMLLLLHRKPSYYLDTFFTLRIRPLKACIRLVTWTYPDPWGIAPELAGYESDFDNNADGWYD